MPRALCDRTENRFFARIFRSFFFVFIPFFMAFQASAQNIPPGDAPGAEASRFQQNAEERERALRKKKAVTPEIEIEEKDQKPAAEGVSFILKELVVTGSAVFGDDDLKDIYSPYIGKEVSLGDLDSIARKIKARYEQKGYLTAMVYVPEQKIVSGKVELRVVEGRMGNLKVEGNRWFRALLLERYFHAKKNEILDLKTVIKDLIRINQNPDLEVKAVISPGAEFGTSDVTLKVADKFPYHAGAGCDNQGTRLSGKDRALIWARSSSLTGSNDSFYASTLLAQHSCGQYVSYLLPLTTYGTKAGIDFSYFDMKLAKEFLVFDIVGTSQVWVPHVSQELYLSENIQVNGDIGMEIKSVKQKMGSQTVSHDELRLPYLGFDMAATDHFFGGGRTTFAPCFTFGTGDFLGASSRGYPSASRLGTGGFFFKYAHSMGRIQKSVLDSYVVVRSQFQGASQTLDPSEQIQLGGANSVRGYPEGDYLADTGATLNVDWVFPMYLIPKDCKLPGADMPLYRQIEPVIFTDLGGGMLMKTMPGERKDKFLMGIGGGLRIHFNRNLYLRLEWAGSVGEKPVQGAGPSTFNFSFQAEI